MKRTNLYNTLYEQVCDEADAIDWGDQTHEQKLEWITNETRRRHIDLQKPDTPDIDAIAQLNYENRRV